MTKGVVKVTAYLQNPDGLWKEDFPVEYELGRQQQAMVPIVQGLSAGLLRLVGADEIEFIPISRVRNITLVMETSNIELATSIPATAVKPAARR